MTSVSFDWATALTSALQFIGPIAFAFLVWLGRKLPGQVGTILQTQMVEQLLQRALDYAVSFVTDLHSKPLTVDLHNAVVAQAVQYALDHGPAWLITWMGGSAGVQQKIIARLNTVAAPAAATPAAAAPATTAAKTS